MKQSTIVTIESAICVTAAVGIIVTLTTIVSGDADPSAIPWIASTGVMFLLVCTLCYILIEQKASADRYVDMSDDLIRQCRAIKEYGQETDRINDRFKAVIDRLLPHCNDEKTLREVCDILNGGEPGESRDIHKGGQANNE